MFNPRTVTAIMGGHSRPEGTEVKAIRDLSDTVEDEMEELRDENKRLAKRQVLIVAGVLVVSFVQVLMLAGIL